MRKHIDSGDDIQLSERDIAERPECGSEYLYPSAGASTCSRVSILDSSPHSQLLPIAGGISEVPDG